MLLHRHRGAGSAFLACWLATPSCKSANLAKITQDCSLNSDCNSPLVCVFQRCHSACRTSYDCPLPQRCVPSGVDAGTSGVCQLDYESTCIDRTCVGDLVCGVDQRCRAPCVSSASCILGQTCSVAAGASACVDPTAPADQMLLGGGGADAGLAEDSGTLDARAVGDGFGGGLQDAPTDQNGSSFTPADGGLGFPIPNVDLAALDAGLGGGAGIFTRAPDVHNANEFPSPFTIWQADTSADLYILNSLTIDPTSMWSPLNNTRAVIVVVRTTVDIQGLVAVNATSVPGPGGYGEFFGSGCLGAGPGGGQVISNTSLLGGGGAGYCGAGGQGAVTPQSYSPAASGGKPYGDTTLVPLLGGSAGGCGGPGGGAVEIVAGQSITIEANGAINAGGGGGGGGGSGGAILLASPTITIRGTLAANGGAGGGGSSGQSATASAQPASGGTLWGLQAGGNGSAGTVINGADGVFVMSDGSASGGGGGGGGAGRIRINTANGMANIASGAVISPDLSTSCATQGTLTP
jgi:hypothetical protein